MQHPQWTEDLSIGLHAIDSQHKQLFAISQALHTAILTGQGDEAVKETFEALEAYVTRHFLTEEDFMRAIGYPDIKNHMAQHEQLRLRFRRLWNREQRSESIKPEDIAFFLGEWLAGHIKTSDKAIGEFARSQE